MHAILLLLGCYIAGARARVDLFKQLEILNIRERLWLIAPEQVLRKYNIARENGSECERDVALYEEAIRRRESWALRSKDIYQMSISTRSILTGQVSFFLCDCGSKIRFLIVPMRFCFISNFRFSQNLFLLFLMIGSRYFHRMDSIRKRIKIPNFQLSRFFCY